MATHGQLAEKVRALYLDYANCKFYKPQFKTAPKEALLQLIQLRERFCRDTIVVRPPVPAVRILRSEAYDQYMSKMHQFFVSAGLQLPAGMLNIPQTEAVANFLAGIKHPPDRLYEGIVKSSTPKRGSINDRITSILTEFACSDYFPVRLHDLRADHKRRMLAFLENYKGRRKHRPPLPKHKKIFMTDYFLYRKRAQAFFDNVGFPVGVAYLNLGLIEALLNFMAGRRHPDKKSYQRVFAANAKLPVHYFIDMYKPFENAGYPISVGQYHGRKDEITPLLYFKPGQVVQRWFPAPNSTKIKTGRRQLFRDYQEIFKRLGIDVPPRILPIAYIEAVLNFAKDRSLKTADPQTAPPIQQAG